MSTDTERAAAPAVKLGPLMFQFDNFAGWVNHAQRIWRFHGLRSADTLCLDAQGRPCLIGRDFMIARDEGQFPVRVYLMRDDMPQYKQKGTGSPA